MNDPRSFGAALRRERERRGITLEAIAEQTKVSAGLLEGLERGDVSRWPAGIFRRAFVRGYAEAAGLDSRTVLEAFLRIYPDEGLPAAAPAHVVAAAFGQSQPLRLTLADEDRWFRVLSRTRVLGAAVDLAASIVPGGAVAALVSPAAGWATLACVSVGYHTLGATVLGTTPGLWLATSLLKRREPERIATAGARQDAPAAVDTESAEPPRVAEVLFHPRRRSRHGARVDRYGGRRSSDSRAARR